MNKIRLHQHNKRHEHQLLRTTLSKGAKSIKTLQVKFFAITERTGQVSTLNYIKYQKETKRNETKQNISLGIGGPQHLPNKQGTGFDLLPQRLLGCLKGPLLCSWLHNFRNVSDVQFYRISKDFGLRNTYVRQDAVAPNDPKMLCGCKSDSVSHSFWYRM